MGVNYKSLFLKWHKLFFFLFILFLFFCLTMMVIYCSQNRLDHIDYIRDRCEHVEKDCYFSNVGSTLDEEGNLDLNRVEKTEEICHECTKSCIRSFLGVDSL